MKLQFQKYEIDLGSKHYRILVPNFELVNTYVLKVDKNDFMVFGDQTDLTILSAIFSLTSRKKDVLVHLPTKQNKVDVYLKQQHRGEEQDIVLLHHQLQFPFKDWKTIRQRCKHGELATYEVNERDSSTGVPALYGDHLLVKNQFDTIFMVGSVPVFQGISENCKEVAQEGVVAVKASVGLCYHVHLDRYRRNKEDYNMCINFHC